MKQILLLFCALILMATGIVGQEPERGIGPAQVHFPLAWRRYTMKGEFSVLLPSPPGMTASTVSRKDGKNRISRYFTTSLDDVVYNIEVFENPEPRQSLEEFIAESNARFRYDPATERNLTVDGFPGKEYSAQDKTSLTVVQFFVTEKCLLRFAASGPAAAAPVVKEFLASIKLGDEVDGIKISGGPGTPLDTSNSIFMGKEVEVKASLLTRPEPSYTKNARHNGIEGIVVLRVVFSKTGRVENIEVRSGLPYGLTEQAIKAAKEIRFIPAMKDGKYVSMWMQLEYDFNLK
ncbi:MAG TPA: energy transducer TonB [Pyrinomonadaceae bacterium]|nr:energy transducer TonB [Pyrinomonadaceae bacterium]